MNTFKRSVEATLEEHKEVLSKMLTLSGKENFQGDGIGITVEREYIKTLEDLLRSINEDNLA